MTKHEIIILLLSHCVWDVCLVININMAVYYHQYKYGSNIFMAIIYIIIWFILDFLNHGNVQVKYDYNVDDNNMFRIFPTGKNELLTIYINKYPLFV